MCMLIIVATIIVKKKVSSRRGSFNLLIHHAKAKR